MIFPAYEQVTQHVTQQVTQQVKDLIKILDKEMNRKEIQEKLNLSDRENIRSKYINPALNSEIIEMTISFNTIR